MTDVVESGPVKDPVVDPDKGVVREVKPATVMLWTVETMAESEELGRIFVPDALLVPEKTATEAAESLAGLWVVMGAAEDPELGADTNAVAEPLFMEI